MLTENKILEKLFSLYQEYESLNDNLFSIIKNEDQIISIMQKIIQNKDIKAEKLKTDKSTERIKKKLENTEEIEALEEFKFYKKVLL